MSETRRSVQQRPVIEAVLTQYVEQCESLCSQRAVLLRSPHVELYRLARLDERLAAHLDGLMTCGEQGLARLLSSLDPAHVGSAFALCVLALRCRDADLLTRVVTLGGAEPGVASDLLNAMAWVSAADLQGTIRALLGSKVPAHRAWGLRACAMHRVDPGSLLIQALIDPQALVRQTAWDVAGQLGRLDVCAQAQQLISVAASTNGMLAKEAPPAGEVGRAAARAQILLGQGDAIEVRQVLLSLVPGQLLAQQGAHRLAAMSAPLDWGRDQVRALAPQAEASAPHKRRMLRLAAWVGDVQVIPWLIGFMADDVWARLAGEAFSLITGADLALLDIERKPPEGIDFGPNDNPEDENVAMDEDDSLPWPDQAKVQAWWLAHAARFVPGQRYFAGEPPSPAHCIQVLKTKGQRQRIMAAEYLCLLRPGSKLFQVTAPAWRQSRWLVEEEAALSAHAEASS